MSDAVRHKPRCIDTLRFTGFAPSLLDGCRREPRHLHVQLSRGPRFRSNIHGHSPFHFTDHSALSGQFTIEPAYFSSLFDEQLRIESNANTR